MQVKIYLRFPSLKTLPNVKKRQAVTSLSTTTRTPPSGRSIRGFAEDLSENCKPQSHLHFRSIEPPPARYGISGERLGRRLCALAICGRAGLLLVAGVARLATRGSSLKASDALRELARAPADATNVKRVNWPGRARHKFRIKPRLLMLDIILRV